MNRNDAAIEVATGDVTINAANKYSAPVRLMRRLASLRLTLILFALLACGIVIAYRLTEARTWPVVIPLLLLAVNLIAAVATNGVFRRQTALLVFHLSLIALLFLIAAGRLTYLTGHVGVTDGVTFDGILSDTEQGPWHDGNLASIRFVSRGFTIDYDPGLQRGPTRNQVAWLSADGRWREAEIGDQEPLVIEGYRFYTTHNKGFAPVFTWKPHAGPAVQGSVQLPPFPMQQYSQAAQWTPPGATEPVWVMLDIDEVVLNPEDRTHFRLPENYKLVARIGQERHEMKPGDSVQVGNGTLVFDGLRGWMGYKVFYDWTLPWLFSACALAVVSLACHFWQKFSARPWDA
ncbi:cytochrome c biogenesis protein ResB [Azoarcus sp. KH32C]|uniref:cytochrome c biogenesis protein ResB n=1 Tax=Azoarcus sp. KH32C TaxID=748247 RepID=UPI00023869E3|nr:cytochrome c biogenesis protein ResB [Azoarcus sp. KH32C]BAL22685.1 hypothetical protein AZKH_0339 [Azoarcus sp. KH32C]